MRLCFSNYVIVVLRTDINANLNYLYTTYSIIILANNYISTLIKEQIDIFLYMVTSIIVILLIKYLMKFI